MDASDEIVAAGERADMVGRAVARRAMLLAVIFPGIVSLFWLTGAALSLVTTCGMLNVVMTGFGYYPASFGECLQIFPTVLRMAFIAR